MSESHNRLELDIYGLTEEQFDALLDIITRLVEAMGGEAGGGEKVEDEEDSDG